MDSAKLFFSGGLAGAIGISCVYPIDLVKTRMQNQSNKIRYKNSIDCLYKTIRKEGFLGLFKGLRPQLLGVAPEKSIKLAVNDIMKSIFHNNSNKKLTTDILSGATAGLCQIVITNPLEITKIRIQVHGETNPTKSISLGSIYKDLGFKGMYKGSRACSIRDTIFSGIYFPTYDRLKDRLSNENGINPMNLVTAGTVSGFCASSITTPLDVIKTRLQVKPRPGERKYNGIYDCYKKIVKFEGHKALFKGIVPRVLRSAPQFGITLYCYEMFKNNI